MDRDDIFEFPEALRWPRFPPWDPVPDWIMKHLEVEVLRDLLMADLDFERDMLERRVKNIDQKREILHQAM